MYVHMHAHGYDILPGACVYTFICIRLCVIHTGLVGPPLFVTSIVHQSDVHSQTFPIILRSPYLFRGNSVTGDVPPYPSSLVLLFGKSPCHVFDLGIISIRYYAFAIRLCTVMYGISNYNLDQLYSPVFTVRLPFVSPWIQSIRESTPAGYFPFGLGR